MNKSEQEILAAAYFRYILVIIYNRFFNNLNYNNFKILLLKGYKTWYLFSVYS